MHCRGPIPKHLHDGSDGMYNSEIPYLYFTWVVPFSTMLYLLYYILEVTFIMIVIGSQKEQTDSVNQKNAEYQIQWL